MERSRLLGALGAAVLLCLGAAAPAFAAPSRTSADPEPGAEVHGAPGSVTLGFSEPLLEGSEITVLDECGNRLDSGETNINLNEMSTDIAKDPTGTYTVQYIAKGVTGDTADSYEFEVKHAGPPCDGSDGGGHGNHGGNQGGNGGNNHGGNHGGNDGGHSGHDGGDGTGATHQGGHSSGGGSGHSGMSHSGESMSHGMGKHGSGKGHGKRHGNGKHGAGKHGNGHGKGQGEIGGPIAGEEIPAPPPSTAAVLTALALATAFGGLGGWVLRVAGPR